jgi:ribose-phosphate pyrophosphokinase
MSMIKNINITGVDSNNNLHDIEYTCFKFSAGELQVKLTDIELVRNCSKFVIHVKYKSSDDLIQIALLRDALWNLRMASCNLVIPYLPYSRQDRVCSTGEASSLSVIGSIIDAMGFDEVLTYDVHSKVAFNRIADLKEYSQAALAYNTLKDKIDLKNVLLVAPDKGASVKIKSVADKFGLTGFLQGTKIRDTDTGKLTGFDVNCNDFQGRDVLIVDDICEKGGTFIGLAEVLKQRNCGKLYLYVTHGFFSGGMLELNHYFDGIYCACDWSK